MFSFLVSTNTFYSGQQQGSSNPSLPNHNPMQKSAAGNVPSRIIASSSVLGNTYMIMNNIIFDMFYIILCLLKTW